MITELRAYNFKSWQDTDMIEFAPLTGFFGANNSGKTSILQLLLLLKQTTESPLDPEKPLYFGDGRSPVNLVDFDTIIHRPENNKHIQILVSWLLSEKLTFQDIGEIDTLSFFLEIFMGTLGAFHYGVNGRPFKVDTYRKNNPGGKYDVSTPYGEESAQSLFRCYGARGIPPTTQTVFIGLEKAFENLFSRVHYLGPRREDPRRYYPWKQSHPKDVGQYGEKTISALLSSLVQQRFTYPQVMKWLQKLELIHSCALESTSNTEQGYKFLVRQHRDGPEVGLTDVGFGISQVLPVLTLCYYVPEGSILIFEQPEAHLHPKAQSDLADVFIDVVKNRNIQIILESHSEHLLLRLMRRIAEEEISADQTAFHFCEIKGGNSRAEQLKVDEYGNISNWPQNFFGDDMGDVAKKTKAEMKRRKANK